jgi:hypothetical protein
VIEAVFPVVTDSDRPEADLLDLMPHSRPGFAKHQRLAAASLAKTATASASKCGTLSKVQVASHQSQQFQRLPIQRSREHLIKSTDRRSER